jgi:hypothetical protein
MTITEQSFESSEIIKNSKSGPEMIHVFFQQWFQTLTNLSRPATENARLFRNITKLAGKENIYLVRGLVVSVRE